MSRPDPGVSPRKQPVRPRRAAASRRRALGMTIIGAVGGTTLITVLLAVIPGLIPVITTASTAIAAIAATIVALRADK